MTEMPEPEIYTPERVAEFLLNDWSNAEEYRWAMQEVVRLGVDPLRVEHLFRDEDRQNPALYLNADLVQRTS